MVSKNIRATLNLFLHSVNVIRFDPPPAGHKVKRRELPIARRIDGIEARLHVKAGASDVEVATDIGAGAAAGHGVEHAARLEEHQQVFDKVPGAIARIAGIAPRASLRCRVHAGQMRHLAHGQRSCRQFDDGRWCDCRKWHIEKKGKEKSIRLVGPVVTEPVSAPQGKVETARYDLAAVLPSEGHNVGGDDELEQCRLLTCRAWLGLMLSWKIVGRESIEAFREVRGGCVDRHARQLKRRRRFLPAVIQRPLIQLPELVDCVSEHTYLFGILANHFGRVLDLVVDFGELLLDQDLQLADRFEQLLSTYLWHGNSTLPVVGHNRKTIVVQS